MSLMTFTFFVDHWLVENHLILFSPKSYYGSKDQNSWHTYKSAKYNFNLYFFISFKLPFYCLSDRFVGVGLVYYPFLCISDPVRLRTFLRLSVGSHHFCRISTQCWYYACYGLPNCPQSVPLRGWKGLLWHVSTFLKIFLNFFFFFFESTLLL